MLRRPGKVSGYNQCFSGMRRLSFALREGRLEIGIQSQQEIWDSEYQGQAS
jgi:hypothetical protein